MAAAHHPAPAGGFTARLKTALVGDPTARFVYLNNFEVERVWGQGEPRLPGTGLSFSSATVNRIEEVGVLLADEHDAVVLKDAVDPGYAAYLRALGAAEGRHLTVDRNDPGRSVTLDALDSPRLLAALRELADGRTHLMPLGISADEERLAEAAGLPLAGPSAAICKQVNGKVFSRELIDAAGLTQVPRHGLPHPGRAAGRARRAPARAGLPGGGQGVARRLRARHGGAGGRSAGRAAAADAGPPHRGGRAGPGGGRALDRQAGRPQLPVRGGPDGTVGFETVKTALTENGVHRGHLFPPALRPEQVEELRGAAEVIGKELAAAGYFGLVGVDALLAADDTLYPCLEINARFNMATYQNRIAERLVPAGSCALATTFDLKPGRPYSFDELRAALGGLLLDRADGDRADGDREPRGVLINNFATLNATVLADGKPYGRLYAICVGDDEADVRRTRDRAQTLLTEMVATP